MPEREPDHTQDPRDLGMSDQYPEENPAGQTPRDGTEQGPESGTDNPDAPQTSDAHESGPGQATGNPDAAG